MNTLTASSEKIQKMIKNQANFLRWFKHVYLFGSILDEEAQHNDIDILVVYKTYSKEVENAIHSIKNVLERESGIMIDLTALSIEEETETAFLKRIEPRYLQLK